MPDIPFDIQTGVYKDETPLKAEGWAIDADKMRVRNGGWQVMGGFEKMMTASFDGIARGGVALSDRSGQRVAAFGTEKDLFAFYDGDFRTITPVKFRGLLVDPFTVKNNSKTVQVKLLHHGLKDGDQIAFSGAEAVGGITIDGDYEVKVIHLDQIEITHSLPALSDAAGGGKVECLVALDAGLTDGIGGWGFGTGPFGSGPFGKSAVGGDIHPRRWSLDSWGDFLVACPRNGAFYEFQPVLDQDKIVIDNTDLEQDVRGVLQPGVTYECVIDVSRTAGNLKMEIISKPGETETPFEIANFEANTQRSFYFRVPPAPYKLKFTQENSFSGALNALSMKIAPKAYRIHSAPPYSRAMFVDPVGSVFCLGTVMQNGDFNAMAVRWSDLNDNREWLSSATNFAGEVVLKEGSTMVGGLNMAGGNVLWSDTTAYLARFTHFPGDAYKVEKIGSACGLKASAAAAEVDGRVFWWGANDNFYTFSPAGLQQMVCSLRDDVANNLAAGQQEKIQCFVNSSFNEVWWVYPDKRDGNEVSRYIAYNYLEDKWTCGTYDRTCWISSKVYPYPIGISAGGEIFFHEKGNSANGAPFSWHLETAFTDLGEGDRVMGVKRFLPDFHDQQGPIDMTLTFRDRVSAKEWTKGPYILRTNTRKVDFKHTGRQMKARFSGKFAGTFARFGHHRLTVQPKGKR